MAYQVVLADSAKADADRIYDWVVERAPVRGPEWFEETVFAFDQLDLESQPGEEGGEA